MADMALAATRLELAQAQHTDVTNKIKVGVLAASALSAAQAELRTMEAAAMRARLNVEEIKATAIPPRDDLNAPLVGGRDFVSQRIQLDLAVAQGRLTATEKALAEADRRERVGARGASSRDSTRSWRSRERVQRWASRRSGGSYARSSWSVERPRSSSRAASSTSNCGLMQWWPNPR